MTDRTSVRYRMETQNGDVYLLDADGYVIERSNGPQDWDYAKGWRILGVTTRANAGSHRIIPVQSLAEGAPFGQGWVHDVDHGTHRMWASPSTSRLRHLTKVERRPI